jgi:hypothetical protein
VSEAGAGVFWAVAMMVDTSRNVRSRRMGVRVLDERISVFAPRRRGDAEKTSGKLDDAKRTGAEK